MFKNFFPNKILSLNNKLINSLLIPMILIFFVGLMYALFISPPDYIQGDSVRIMYVHVPSSFIALGFFGFIGIASILNLIFKIKFVSLMAKSLAPIGCIFSLVSIITGSLWGKPTWGTWWVWDARLTSTLILFFLYASIISLFSVIDKRQKADRASSILSVVGIVIIPVIKKSVDWWQTLHQSSTFSLSSSPSMTSDMYTPLLACVIAFYLVFILIVLNRLKVEIILRERSTNWVKQQFFNTL